MVMQYSEQSADVGDSFEVLGDTSTYAGVIGLMSGAFIGGLLTYIPFYKLEALPRLDALLELRALEDTLSFLPVVALTTWVRE